MLRRSLRYCVLVEDLIEEARQQVQLIDIEPGPRPAKYCSLCEIEIFNIYFIKKLDESMKCVECARGEDPTFNDFSVKQDYAMKHLMKLYDNFIDVRKKFREKTRQD